MYQPPVMPGAYPMNDAQDAAQNKTMAILAYLGILVLIPLFSAKESKFARYHTNQGLILAIVEVIYSIVSNIISSAIISSVIDSGRWLYSGSLGGWGIVTALLGLIWIAFLAFSIIGILNAVNGRCKPLPFIGNITLLR